MVRVYLDSSDYSVMSDLKNGFAQEVRAKLRQYIDAGQIKIRFSSVHVMECAHVDAPSKPMALLRAQTIMELSQGKCFRWWPDVGLSEALRLISGRREDSGAIALSDEGQWFPPVGAVAKQLRTMFVDGIKEVVRGVPIPDHQRRELLNTLIKSGRFTPAAISLLAPARAELLNKLSEEFPISPRFFEEDLMMGFTTGKVSAVEVVEELAKSFSDLVAFVGWVYDQHDKERMVTTWLRQQGRDLVETLLSVRNKTIELRDIGQRLGKNEKDLNRQLMTFSLNEGEVRKKWLRALYQQHSSVMERKKISSGLWEKRVVDSELGSTPSFDAYLEASASYFRRNITLSSSPRSLLNSDAGDLMHMCHLPYVRIFRCDGAASEVANKVAQRYGTIVVNKLSKLTSMIESTLAERR